MIKYYAINGQLTRKEEAALRVTDLAIQRGYGQFDYFVVRQGQPLFLEDYLDRFYNTAKFLHLVVPATREELSRQIHEVVQANGLPDAGIKLILTGGYADDGYSPTQPNLVVMELPLPNYPPEAYSKGVKLMLHEYHRTFPTAKTINYLVGIYLLPQMRAAGAEDVLFHWGGNIYETTRANFFIVTPQDVLVTAGEGILGGVTRKKTLEIGRRHYQVEERFPTVEELKTAKEAFITSSTKRVLPVTKVDDMIIGNGDPGPVTERLLALFFEEEAAYLTRQLGK
jgi:branched-subunit amino acid aminotransferase/4-amino-4-deoxychorismate lyase